MGAVLAGDGLRVRPAGGEWTAASGPVAFPNGAVIEAQKPGVARVACGGRLSEKSTAGGRPGAGLIDLHLGAGAAVRRREGTALDLLAGEVRLRAGPPKARVVLFHGTAFLEIPVKNARGVDVVARADGDALTIEVTSGDVVLNSTGATQKEIHYVRLGPGESATARPGSPPVKHEPQESE